MKPLTQKSQNPKIEGVGVEKLEGLEVENFCSSEDQQSSIVVAEPENN